MVSNHQINRIKKALAECVLQETQYKLFICKKAFDKAFQKYFDQKVPRNIFKALVEKIQQRRIYKYIAMVKMP